MPRKAFPTSVKTVGDQIQVKRIEARLTQRELARKVGVTPQTVQAWELDAVTPSAEEVRLLCEVLGFPFGVGFPDPTAECLVGVLPG